MTERVIIVGAGHNGLVCAAYLAAKGHPVTVLEAAAEVGGAAATREFAPGFKVSACAHLLYLLDPGIARELELSEHGLKYAAEDLDTVALAADGDHLTLSRGGAAGAGISAAEQSALGAYRERMGRFAALLGRLHRRAPPRIAAGGHRDWLGIARLALDLRLLGRKRMREFLRIAGINIYDVLRENFEHPLLQGALALDAVLGNQLGPRSNNSVLNALHRASGAVNGKAGALALPVGGIGAVAAALAASATARGVEIRTASEVARILVEDGCVGGVELASGERLDATLVVSNADPRTTLFGLVGARNLDAGFARRVQHLRMRGHAAKLHLALDGLPEFTGLDPARLGARLVVAPDLEYLERAFDHSKYRRFSPEPALEITLPSVSDPSLAPSGKHVLSAVAQYAPYHVDGGWDGQREAFAERVMAVLEQYAPGIGGRVVARELLTPVDIEREFRIEGGHWHHGEFVLDQALMLRPFPGAAQYAMPLPGLYLCGAGCHPGGGVMGHAGRNAADTLLRDLKR